MEVDVVITRSNSIVNSPRVRKMASSLKGKYETKVIGWNRDGTSKDIGGFVTDLDLLNFKSPIGRMTIILYFPVFWVYLFAKLVRYRPKVIHACDLDTLPPSLIFKILFRRTLVFDVCDRYALSKIPPSRARLYAFVNWMEEYLGQKADYMINVSKKREGTFKRKPKKTAIIMNCADNNTRSLVGVHNNRFIPYKGQQGVFTLVYTGNISRNRGLEQISNAIKNMKSVQLIIAGNATDPEFLDQLLAQSKIKYCGQLSLAEALELESIADLMVILYDPRIPNNRYANPNKLFEAMMFGIPVLTNVVEEIIQEANCGILVEYENSEQIASAISLLRDDTILRNRLGENGRAAFEQRYNWSIMEKTLLNIYEELQAVSRI